MDDTLQRLSTCLTCISYSRTHQIAESSASQSTKVRIRSQCVSHMHSVRLYHLPKARNRLGIVGLRWEGQLERFLRQVCAALQTYWFFWFARNIFEDDAKKLVGEIEDTHFKWSHS